MILNSSIKAQIIGSVEKSLSNYTKYERIATEIIFYKYILSYLEVNPSQQNNIADVVSSHVSNFLYNFIQLKNRYTSYLHIITFLNKVEPGSFIGMKEADIDYVYNLYLSGKLIEDFDPDIFNQSVYGVDNLDANTYDYLRHIHFDVMAHIGRYYSKFYNIPNNSLKIIDANTTEVNVGKRIEFFIDGVPTSKIYADIMGNKFPISYYQINFKFPNIEIINN